MKKDSKGQISVAKEFGNYILGKSLGEGTFGKVKRATHKITNESVAIKILEKSKINDQADTERVMREIHILKLVRHPNIVQLYEIIETPKTLFLVIEFMENGELFDYISNNKRLKEDEARRLFHQLIDGVDHIHKIGICHRDLKPENLLLDYRMDLKIVDFGLSNTYKRSERLKTACGSPCYAAPEMLKGESYEPLGVDIWSAGVILFAMLCGYLPFEDNKNQAELYKSIMEGDYSITVSLSDPAKDLIRKILTVDPQYRYTIDEIRKHPWMTYNSTHKKSSKGIVVGYNKIPIDHNILNSLSDFDISAEKTQSELEANRHTNLTTSYYLTLKKFLKDGGESACDIGSRNFDKSLLEPPGSNNRRDTSKNGVLIENFFTGNTENNSHLRKKSKEKVREKFDKSREKSKENREPNQNYDRSRENIMTESKIIFYSEQLMIPIKKSRTNSKISRIDPKIESSFNYGRPSTTKSIEKLAKREPHFENRLNRRYKEKFNQSLISKSKDKITQNVSIQHSYHQPHSRSRVDSSITRTNRNEPYEVTEVMQDLITNKQKKTNSKKLCGQVIKSDQLKIAKARWM